jgi:hypothetical protein
VNPARHNNTIVVFMPMQLACFSAPQTEFRLYLSKLIRESRGEGPIGRAIVYVQALPSGGWGVGPSSPLGGRRQASRLATSKGREI